MYIEDKQRVCDKLCETLQLTRQYSDMVSITYDWDDESVAVKFQSGATINVNVAMDSSAAMIRDIMKALYQY